MSERVMIIIARPQPMTSATASAWDFSAFKSRSSLRSRSDTESAGRGGCPQPPWVECAPVDESQTHAGGAQPAPPFDLEGVFHIHHFKFRTESRVALMRSLT